MKRGLLIAGLLLVLPSCASTPGSGGSSRSRNVISSEEIASITATTAWDIVQKLRPNWLNSRGPISATRSTPEVPVVYIDEVRTGGLSTLEALSSHIVQEIRFLAGPDATTRYGLGHGGGAILVTTKR